MSSASLRRSGSRLFARPEFSRLNHRVRAAFAGLAVTLTLLSSLAPASASGNQRPTAGLSVTPGSGFASLAVLADASASADADGSIASFTFDFGDGTVIGPQAAPTAAHTYAPGNWIVKVTVVDNVGASAMAAAPVAAHQNLVGNPSFESATTGWAAYLGTMARIAGGAEGDSAVEVTGPASVANFGINDSPNWIKTVQGAGTSYRFTAAVRSGSAAGIGRLQVREYKGGVQQGPTTRSANVTLSPSWQTITIDHVALTDSSTLDFHVLDVPVVAGEVFQVDQISIRIVGPDLPPVVFAPSAVTTAEGEPLAIEVLAVDPDGQPIVSLGADLSALPAGHDASFTPGAANAAGTLLWTPGFDHAGGPYPISFTAANALSGSAMTAVAVNGVDRAPVVGVDSIVAALEGEAVVVQVTAADPDGDPIDSLIADLSELPAGHDAIFTPATDNASGTLTWTPVLGDGGQAYAVRFVAANAQSDTAAASLVVTDLDRAPVVLAPAAVSATEDAAVSIEISITDPDGDPIDSLTFSGLPGGAAAVLVAGPGNTTATLTWTPSFEDSGTHVVTFLAANALGGVATTEIVVANVDRAPLVAAAPPSGGAEGALVTVEVVAGDPDGDPIASLVADLGALPAGDAVFTPAADNASGTLTWTPGFTDAGGPYVVSFTATNALGGSDTTAIVVTDGDRAPVVSAPASAATMDSAQIVIEVTAQDLDGDAIATLTADLSSLPAGHDAVFAPGDGNATGTLTWTPALGASGSFAVSFVAANAASDTAITIVQVTRIDHPPVVSAPVAVSIDEGAVLTLEVTVADPDGDAIDSLLADLSALPPGASFTPAADHASGTLAWTPGFAAAGGPSLVVFTAGNALVGSASTAITVIDVDRAPQVTAPASLVVREGETLAAAVTAADPDGDAILTLAADLAALPAGHGAAFTPGAGNLAGTLDWTPQAGDAGGPYLVVFTAHNALSGVDTLAVTVLAPNQPPVAALVVSPAVSSAPVQVTANAVGSTDGDGGIATYRFDFGNGVVVGPQAASSASATYAAAGVYTVTVIVTDVDGAADTSTARVAAHLGNLCVNPSFENTTTGWTSYGAGSAIVRLNGMGRTGSYAFQASAPAAGTWGMNDSPDWVPVTAGAGRVYRVMAWVRSVANSGQAYLRVQEFLGAAQQGTATHSPKVTLSPTWQLVSVDRTTIATGSRLDMKILCDAAGPGEKFLIDDVQVLMPPQGDQPPVLRAPASMVAIAGQPLALQIAAADPDGQSIASLGANLLALPPGHDATFTPAADRSSGTLTWTPTLADVGPVPYVVTVTAANGLVKSTPVEIVVASAGLPNLCANPAFETNASGWSPYVAGTTITRVNSGRSGSFAVQLAASGLTGWGLNDQLDIVLNTPAAGRTYRYAAWVRSAGSAGKVKLRIQEFLGATQKGVTTDSPEITLSTTWQRLACSYTVTTAGTRLDAKVMNAPVVSSEAFMVDDVEVLLMPQGDRPPVLTGPGWVPAARGEPITLSVTAVDPDGDPIGALTADLSGLPAGHGAVFTPGPNNGSGILSWTPGAADVRVESYVVTFAATNSKNAIVTAAIAVGEPSGVNLCANPGFESNSSGWGTYGAVALARIADAHSGGFGLRMTANSGSLFGCDDNPNWVATTSAVGARYRFSAWVRSTNNTSPARLRVYELVGGVQQGATVMSQEILLSTQWQRIVVDHTALASGSTLSLRVTMVPGAAGQSFVVDDVVIQPAVGGATAMALAGDPEASAAEADSVQSDETQALDGGLTFTSSFAPNPMRGDGLLSFATTRPGAVQVDLYDATGRRVRTLLDEPMLKAGRHQLAIGDRRGAVLANGVYFYRIAASEGVRRGRVVVVR